MSKLEANEAEVQRLVQRLNEEQLVNSFNQTNVPNYLEMSGARPRSSTRGRTHQNGNERLEQLRQAFESAPEQRTIAENEVSHARQALEGHREGKRVTAADFLHYAEGIVRPAIKYYNDHINSDLLDVRRGIAAACVFDPFFIRDNDLNTLRIRIHDLRLLHLPAMGNGCIEGMLSEISQLKEDIRECLYEFECVEGSEEYNEKHGANPWMDDHSEYSRRIVKWWKSRSHRFTYFVQGLKLVSLIQTSSAFVERLFSQLKIILSDIGEEALIDNIETRAMRQINKDQV